MSNWKKIKMTKCQIVMNFQRRCMQSYFELLIYKCAQCGYCWEGVEHWPFDHVIPTNESSKYWFGPTLQVFVSRGH
jgi:hypothetical protein